ncbi:MAG: hypothetical protein KH301_08710 [Brachyspira sp.]|mgnify:CR=1 FL=1|nr:hypothetical protein [Brachyspira sp.]
MKINSITSFRSSYNSQYTQNKKNNNVSFGFGEDYGIDPSDFDSCKASKPSTTNALKYLAELAFAVGSELFGSEKKRLREIERLGWELEMREQQEKREQLKQQKAAEDIEDLDDFDDWD